MRLVSKVSFTDQLAKKYGNLFSLPSIRTLIVEMFLIAAIFGVIVYAIVPGIQDPIFGLVDGVVSLAFGSIISTYIILKVGGNGILNPRRAIALTDAGIVFLGIGLFASALASRGFNNAAIFSKVYFISCGIIVAYSYIVLAVVCELKQIKLFILSFIQPLMILTFHSILIYTLLSASSFNILVYFLGFILMGFVAYGLGRWFYLSVENVGKELLGYGSVVLFKAFLDAFMLDRTGLLEAILKALSIRNDIEVRTLSFKGNDQKGIVIAPLIHPGPFGDLGSSKLPTKIATQFLGEKVFPVVFHTPTSHDKDLILKKDCERVMQEIHTMEGGEVTNLAGPVVVKKRGAITVSCQIFDNVPLVVITRSPIPTEDLPDFVNDICMEKIKEKGYNDGIIVDAHNVMDTKYTELSELDRANILDALTDALEEIEREGPGKLYAGFANVKLENYTVVEGIGDGGIMALVTEVKNQKGAFVAIDGNNMMVGLREKIQEALRKSGYSPCEITTTDTHIVTGHSTGESYFPLGKAIPEGVLIDKIMAAVKEADSRKAECLVKFSKRKVDNVYLLGNKGIENLWRVTDKTIKVAKKRAAALVVLLVGIGVVLYALI